MKFSFKAKVFKVGINPCVQVPLRITKTMTATKGYIPVNGTINQHPFQQTLVPVKNSGYRLYVNGPMLKGADTTVGKTATFVLEQNLSLRPRRDSAMFPEFKRRLKQAQVLSKFNALTPSRQKEILRYLHYLKTAEARVRNIEKVILGLKEGYL